MTESRVSVHPARNIASRRWLVGILLAQGLCAAVSAEQPAGTPPAPTPVDPGRPVISRPKQPASMPQPARPEGEIAQPKAVDPTPMPVVPTGPASGLTTVTARPAAPVSVAGTYPVSRFLVRYAAGTNGQLPPEDLVMSAMVALDYDGVAYSPAKAESKARDASTWRTLGDLNSNPGNYTPAAISAVCSAVVKRLNDAGFVAIFVIPSSDDIDDSGKDIRGNRRELVLTVYAGRIRNVTATVVDEQGNKIEGSPVVARAIERSPIQAGSFVDKAALDEQVARLSRHPGRRADAGIAASAEGGASPFDVDLNYSIVQAKPWSVYFNVANTGTRQTNEWRERLGVSHTNLTGNDDILSLDYVTASFENSNAVFGSYELPVWGDDLRVKLFGGWNQYTASDLGIGLGNLKGDGYNFGGEVIYRAVVKPRTDVDLFGGARYERTTVNNEITPGFPIKGDGYFVILSGGVRAQHRWDSMTTSASVSVDSAVTASDTAEVARLGRFDPSNTFTILKGSIEHSMYVEPLLFGAEATTNAHELFFALRGQTAFDNRLSPTFQQTAGGFYTVRGYNEALVAGDNAILASFEYRLHIPRLLTPSSKPGDLLGSPFYWSPPEPMASADWDLITRAFVDAARITNNDRKLFEADQSLVGAGVGVELQYKKNLFLRLDWGVALKAVRDATGNLITDTGDNRLHFSATIAF